MLLFWRVLDECDEGVIGGGISLLGCCICLAGLGVERAGRTRREEW